MSTISENAKAIFLEAVEKHSPEEWPEFLDQACGDDRELRRQVEGLLQARMQRATACSITSIPRSIFVHWKISVRLSVPTNSVSDSARVGWGWSGPQNRSSR